MRMHENTNVTHPGWVFGPAVQCIVYIGIICGPVQCFILELYAEHMFWFYREKRCDPRCVFGPAVQCTLFIGIICGPHILVL